MTHSAICRPDMVGTYAPEEIRQLIALFVVEKENGEMGKPTPPPSEHMKSIALPQQWSEAPEAPQVHDLTQPISRTRPGKAAMTFLAPFTALALQAPMAGTLGAE